MLRNVAHQRWDVSCSRSRTLLQILSYALLKQRRPWQVKLRRWRRTPKPHHKTLNQKQSTDCTTDPALTTTKQLEQGIAIVEPQTGSPKRTQKCAMAADPKNISLATTNAELKEESARKKFWETNWLIQSIIYNWTSQAVGNLFSVPFNEACSCLACCVGQIQLVPDQSLYWRK